MLVGILILLVIFCIVSQIGLNDQMNQQREFLKSHYWCAKCASFKTCSNNRFVKTPTCFKG